MVIDRSEGVAYGEGVGEVVDVGDYYSAVAGDVGNVFEADVEAAADGEAFEAERRGEMESDVAATECVDKCRGAAEIVVLVYHHRRNELPQGVDLSRIDVLALGPSDAVGVI